MDEEPLRGNATANSHLHVFYLFYFFILPGFFQGGGAPLRNDLTDGEVKKFSKQIRIYEEENFISGWGGGGVGWTPLAPFP